jgi:hypothetical protein
MEVPNALPTPITPFANSLERLIAQVVGCACEVKGTPFQYSPTPAVEPHGLDRYAVMMECPLARVCEHFLEGTRTKGFVRGREFCDAEYEAAVRSGRSFCERG